MAPRLEIRMRIRSTASAVLAVVSMVIVLAPEAHGFTGLGACLWRGGAGVAKHLPARSKHAACGLLRPPPPLLEVQRSHASRTRSRCASSVGDHEEGESDVQRTMRHQRQRALSQHAIDALQAEVLQIEAEIDGLQSEVAGLMAQEDVVSEALLRTGSTEQADTDAGESGSAGAVADAEPGAPQEKDDAAREDLTGAQRERDAARARHERQLALSRQKMQTLQAELLEREAEILALQAEVEAVMVQEDPVTQRASDDDKQRRTQRTDDAPRDEVDGSVASQHGTSSDGALVSSRENNAAGIERGTPGDEDLPPLSPPAARIPAAEVHAAAGTRPARKADRRAAGAFKPVVDGEGKGADEGGGGGAGGGGDVEAGLSGGKSKDVGSDTRPYVSLRRRLAALFNRIRVTGRGTARVEVFVCVECVCE